MLVGLRVALVDGLVEGDRDAEGEALNVDDMECGDADREGLYVGDSVAVQDKVNVEVCDFGVGVLVCVFVRVKEGERGTVGPVRLALVVMDVDAVNETDADSEPEDVRVRV